MKPLLLFLLLASQSFAQKPEEGKTILEKQLLLLQRRDLMEGRIADQKAELEALIAQIEAESMDADQLLAAQEEIKRMKELMQSYKDQIDSLAELNELLLQEIEPYPIRNKSLQVDFVQFLEESGEYALSLPFLPDANRSDWYDSMQFYFTQPKFGDDPDYYRYDAPEELVQRFFHTDRLQDAKLYAENNAFVGNGTFQGFEYISQNIEPKMVAVFRGSGASFDTALYAICGLIDTLPAYPLNYYEKSETFHKAHALAIPADYTDHRQLEVGCAKDFHFVAPQAYKVTKEAENESDVNVLAYLYLEHRGEILRAHQLKDDWLYWHLQPLAMSYKDYPILLFEKAMMDSDWFMQGILIWNGTAYEEKSLRFDVGE